MASIELRNICKRFRNDGRLDFDGTGAIANLFAAVFRVAKKMQSYITSEKREDPFSIENLSLTIPHGMVMVILGPSGCGKSTLLRLIAGLMQPDSGEVRYDGINMENTPPGERNIGMVFQDYALYPHFTSRKNVLSYFFFKKSTPELDAMAREKYRKTSELLGVDIEYLMDRKPRNLSGGEKQRVALGRCITRDPVLFLLDEPFSNLDQRLREKYRLELKKLLRHFDITTVYVTHDQQEALILADILAIMNVGCIEQVGAPEDIYNHPHSLFVAEFLNFDMDTPAINLLDGGVISEELKGMIAGVRSEDIEVCEDREVKSVTGTIVDIRHIPIKEVTVVGVNIGKEEVYVRVPLQKSLSINDEICLRFTKYHIFSRNTGLRVRTHNPS